MEPSACGYNWATFFLPIFHPKPFYPEDGDSMFFRNVGIFLKGCTTQQSRRP
jgi:hypothetical protein